MAEKRTPPDPTGAGRRRKRTAPTIDLTATEIPTPPEPAAEQAPAPEMPAAEMTAPEIPPEPVASEPPPPPPPEEERIEAAAPPPEPDHAPPPPPAPESRSQVGTALAAGVAGAAIMAVLLGGLGYAGLLPFGARDTDGTQVAALEKQVQDLRQSLQEVRDRPAPAVDPKAVEALTQRVTRLQNDIATLPPGDKTLAERVGAAENAMRALGVALTALNRRNDDIDASTKQAQASAEAAQKAVSDLRTGMQDVAKDASSAVAPAALDAVQQRVAALEQSLKSAQSEIAKTAAGAQAARLALAASALRDAVESGVSYAPALARVKSLGGDAAALAPLERFAQSGVPGGDALAAELTALMPAIVKASGAEQAPSGGFFERLQANAGKLVRIRPVDAPSGDAVPDVLARLEVAAAKHDIDGALAALARLPDAARQPAATWIAKAEARRAALRSARGYAAARATASGSQ